jgi:hypothetical protein
MGVGERYAWRPAVRESLLGKLPQGESDEGAPIGSVTVMAAGQIWARPLLPSFSD